MKYDEEFLHCINRIMDDEESGDKYELLMKAAALYPDISREVLAAYYMHMCSPDEPYKIFFPEKPTGGQQHVILMSHELTRTGAPVVLADMARVLVEKGMQVIVFSPSEGPLIRLFNDMGCIVIVQPILLRGRYDAADTLDGEDIILPRRLMERAEFTVFCTLVLHNVVKCFIDTDYKIYWWLHEASVSFRECRDVLPERLSDNIHVLAVCEYVEDKFREFDLPGYKGDILNYMVEDTEQQKPDKKDDIVRFVCVGTIDFRKGQDILVDAIKLLPMEYLRRTEFGFVGFKHSPYIVEKVLKLANAFPNVTCYDEMSREEVFALYEDIDCIVSPSRDDPMPVVLTENMRLGNICICSTATGTARYIRDGENGFVFESENAEELAEKIMYIADHIDMLAELKERSRAIYESRFMKERFVENMERLMLS